MPMSDYVRSLRGMVGTTLLEVPTASVVVFDGAGRVLLVRHIEGDAWTTPGGMIEPEETPADAAVRETWEETGLLVEPTRIVGVFGGERCTSTYANGDRIAWVSTVFEARVTRGTPRPDQVETLEVRYVGIDEMRDLPRQPHVDMFVDAALKGSEAALFQPASWRPPRSAPQEGRGR
jgi:8-oxo-dGTP pyrophosphatase MutT (NUDIX family)